MDHCEKERRKINPRDKANICSLVTFSYIVGLFKKGFKRDLQEEDLYEPVWRCNSKRCGDKIEEQWKLLAKKDKQPSILKTVWRRYGRRYLLMGIMFISWTITRTILEPYAITELISCFIPGQTEFTKYDAYYFGGLMVTLHLFHRFFMHNYIMWMHQTGLEIKTSFSSLLYRKALKLTPTAVSEITLGNIVTLITKDVQIFKESIWIVNDVSCGIIQTCVISYLIFAKIGVSSFFGIGVLIASMPIQGLIGRWINKLRLKTGQRTDERLQVTQEALSTIRIIKMYTWERFFGEKINDARRKEINKILLGLYLRSLLIIVGMVFSNLGFYVLIMAYIWMGSTADTTIVFYLLSNFKGLRSALGTEIPWNIGKFAELVSAATRIHKVIEAEELQPLKVSLAQVYNPVVQVKGATVHIGNKEILSNLYLDIGVGLTIITGSVGSGKSSLLKAILQDYPLTSGEIITSGDISYASQDPWLFPSSIKQNILFGRKFDEKRYQDIIRVCALQYDFNLLDDGDETIVTDRGLNLSKGQQARVNLARAIYKDSEIYLLDDSLTALDAHVKDYIFEECIKTYLKDKICILVSQTAHHIDEADNIVIMDKGRIKDFGKPSEKILQEVKEIAVEDDDLEKEVIEEDDEVEPDENRKLLETEQIAKKRIYKEVKKEGKIASSVYKKYIIFGGGFIMLLINCLIGIAAQASESYSDKLLTQWVDEKQNVLNFQHATNGSTNNTHLSTSLLEAEDQEQSTFRLYSIMLAISTIASLLVIYVNFDFCRRASTNIHKAMVGSIVKAAMPFFDTHFIGNVLNRFSQDLAQIDENIPFIFRDIIGVIFATMARLSLVLYVDKNFMVYVVFVTIVLLVMRRMYIPAGRSLKRLEATTRSPMIGHLNASLEGLTTIRAYKAENILTEEFDRHQDLYTSAYYVSICSMRAFSFYMDCVASTLVVAVVANFLFFDNDGESAGDVGLALTQVSLLGSTIQWGLRQWAEMENHMTSVERVLEYTSIKSEKEEGQVVEDWPSRGVIEYQDVSLAYNNEFVLKNLSFKVEPKQTIGIVGRTGAGKSSLISSIYRLYDVEGRILIDGVDIKTLSLKFLRRKLAIIPQDPILFSGTVRSNLDPFREFQDRDLWTALEKVNLKDAVSSLDMKINTGSNFSSGQKQLFCLARALLRKSKILILDEATANVDHETDVMLHNIISQNFVDCTTFIIAHRLHSILECDKVMVLDRGEISEFDDPLILLENENGLFYKMVKQAGLLNYLS